MKIGGIASIFSTSHLHDPEIEIPPAGAGEFSRKAHPSVAGSREGANSLIRSNVIRAESVAM